MRLDQLIQNHQSSTITAARYERLKAKGMLPIVMHVSEEGWDTSNLDNISESEAKEMISACWKMQQYERSNGIEPHVKGFVVNVVAASTDHEEGTSPVWPEELQQYDTDHFAVAYLCHKFDLGIPEIKSN